MKTKHMLNEIVCAALAALPLFAIFGFTLEGTFTLPADNNVPAPITTATSSISFSNLEQGSIALSAGTYYITSGDVLTISSLTWTPTGQHVSVAFINTLYMNGPYYAKVYETGSVVNKTLSTSNIPSGEYYIAVINYDGPNAVTGAMSYSI